MRTNAVAAGLLAVLAVLAVGVMGGAVADSHSNEADANVSENASVGMEVSSFMQASTAEAEGEVDDGMFEAALNRTEDPEERRQLVENRTRRLQERQQRLEERRGAIGSTGDVRDRALAVRVAVGADHLEKSVNETAPVAESVGVDTERLEQLRENARNLSGGEVAELARGLAGPPADRPGAGGPPATGNATQERPDRMGNASAERPSDGAPGEGDGANRTRRSGAENATDSSNDGGVGGESSGQESGGPDTNDDPERTEGSDGGTSE